MENLSEPQREPYADSVPGWLQDFLSALNARRLSFTDPDNG
jgi:hypothetical protein